MTKFLKFIFHISTLLLIIISLYPGSLLGYLFYGDFGQQPNLIENPFGTTINHFIYYIYVSLLGFFLYLRTENFQKLVYSLFLLSVILELLHFIIPNRCPDRRRMPASTRQTIRRAMTPTICRHTTNSRPWLSHISLHSFCDAASER